MAWSAFIEHLKAAKGHFSGAIDEDEYRERVEEIYRIKDAEEQARLAEQIRRAWGDKAD